MKSSKMKSDPKIRLRAALLGMFAATLMTGCAGYQLGPSNGAYAGAKSIRVNFFENKTDEPRLIVYVNNSLRKTLQQDGTYTLSTRGAADIVVNGTITQYIRSPLTFQPGDAITARDYRIHLTAHVTAIDAHSGKVLLDREVTGRTTIRVGADLGSAERQAAPLLAEDLARNTSALLTEGSW
jgi:hypothetical protein